MDPIYTLSDLRSVTRAAIDLEAASRSFETAQSYQFRREHARSVISAWARIVKLQDELGETFHSSEAPMAVRAARSFLIRGKPSTAL